MPWAFAHCSSGEGSEPGCATIAQPAKAENADSLNSRPAMTLVFIVSMMRESLF